MRLGICRIANLRVPTYARLFDDDDDDDDEAVASHYE